MRPNLLLGVGLRRVRRQEEQLKLAGLALDVLPHQRGLVHVVSVDHHEHRIRSTRHQALQEGLEDRGQTVTSYSMKRNSPLGLTAESMLSEKRRPVAVTTGVCAADAQVLPV